MRARRPICAHKGGDARGGVEREDREGLEGGGVYAEVAESAEKRGRGDLTTEGTEHTEGESEGEGEGGDAGAGDGTRQNPSVTERKLQIQCFLI